MSDYSKTTNFTAKDTLSSGNPSKLVKGSEFDTEFDNLATHIATKYDSGNLASSAQAIAETDNTVLMTPLRVANWADANWGIVGELQALSAPAADALVGYDLGTTAVVTLALGTGLSHDATTLDLEAGLQAISALAKTDGNVIVGNGSTWVAESGATARTSLGLAIGSDVQAYDADLAAIAALANTDGNFIVGNGSTWTVESTTTARTSLGVGTGDSPTFTGATLGSAVLTGPSANRLEVGGRVAFIHDDTAQTSAEIFFSTSAPTTEGSNGDIYFEYTA